jgi:hypothetical protein
MVKVPFIVLFPLSSNNPIEAFRVTLKGPFVDGHSKPIFVL